jgi:hypothetical protein
LQEFQDYVLPGGYLVLVLPVEVELRPALKSDWNLHLQAWTFQTITNLLVSRAGRRFLSLSSMARTCCGPSVGGCRPIMPSLWPTASDVLFAPIRLC